MIRTISPQELHAAKLRGERVDLIDVRSPAEFSEVRVGFARNMPLDVFDPKEVLRARGNATDPLYFICHSGFRSEQACLAMAAAGFTNVVSVTGGTKGWVDAGLPYENG